MKRRFNLLKAKMEGIYLIHNFQAFYYKNFYLDPCRFFIRKKRVLYEDSYGNNIFSQLYLYMLGLSEVIE